MEFLTGPRVPMWLSRLSIQQLSLLWCEFIPWLGNIHIIGVPEGGEREKGTEKVFREITAENFPNMGKEPLTQIQQAQRVPYKINPRSSHRGAVLNESDWEP